MVNITNWFFHTYSTYSLQFLHEGFILKQWWNLARKNKIRSCTTEKEEEEYSSMDKVSRYCKDTAPFISLWVSYSFAKVIWMLEAPKWRRVPENNQALQLGHALKIASGTRVHVKVFQSFWILNLMYRGYCIYLTFLITFRSSGNVKSLRNLLFRRLRCCSFFLFLFLTINP